MSFKEIYEGLIEHETQVKLAAVEKAWAEDAERTGMLDEALDLLKEAQEKGEVPALNSSEALTMAVELVEQAMLEKEAEEWYNIGTEVADLLKEAGITEEDLAKVATPEDEEEFGRFCARLWLSAKTGEDLLGLSEGGEAAGE